MQALFKIYNWKSFLGEDDEFSLEQNDYSFLFLILFLMAAYLQLSINPSSASADAFWSRGTVILPAVSILFVFSAAGVFEFVRSKIVGRKVEYKSFCGISNTITFVSITGMGVILLLKIFCGGYRDIFKSLNLTYHVTSEGATPDTIANFGLLALIVPTIVLAIQCLVRKETKLILAICHIFSLAISYIMITNIYIII